jgi:predicted RND superfamily exporter protein
MPAPPNPPASTRGRRWLAAVILLCLLIPVPLAVQMLRVIRLENDVETWLPAGDPDKQVLDWFRQEFGLDSSLLVSWDDSTLNDPRVEDLAARLAGEPDAEGNRHAMLSGLEDVRTPRDIMRRMLDNKLPREDAIARLEGLVIGTGMLKVRLTETGRGHREEFVRRLRQFAEDELSLDVAVRPPVDESAAPLTRTTASEGEAEDQFAGPQADDPYPLLPSHDLQLHWPRMSARGAEAEQIRQWCRTLPGHGEPWVEDCFVAIGSPVALMVSITPEGQQRLPEVLGLIRDCCREAGIPEEDLHLGGSPVGRNELNVTAATATWNPAHSLWNLPQRSTVLTSMLVGVGLSFIVLRSIRLAIIVLLTSVYTAAVTTALIPATGHMLNMVLIVMPNLLIVVTASGAIHVVNYWRSAVAQGDPRAMSTTIRMAWVPCTLASLTTAIGLASLLTSVLQPVKEFGAYSSLGCLISLAVVLVAVPALLSLWSGSVTRLPEGHRQRWAVYGRFLHRHRMAIMSFCLVGMVAGTYGLRWFRTETKVIRYFRPTARIVQDYNFLEEHLAGIVPIDVVVSFDREAVESMDSVSRLELIREVDRRVATHGEISGTLALPDFRPQLEAPPRGAPLPVVARYRRTLKGLEEFLADPERASQGGLVAVAGQPLLVSDSRRTVNIPRGAELWRIRAQVAVMSDLNYDDLTRDVTQIVREVVGDRPGVQFVVTGVVPLFLRTQQAVLQSLINSSGLAFAVITVVMTVLLRHPVSGLLSMIPNVYPIGLIFGLISWWEIPVDIGTMITASVALGIAIDGTLHLLTWFKDGVARGLPRDEAIAIAIGHCGPALWQTSASIGLGLLMLGFADLLLISRFGWLMCALIGAALVGDIVLLPTLLGGSLGALIERCTPKLSMTTGPDGEDGLVEVRGRAPSTPAPLSEAGALPCP